MSFGDWLDVSKLTSDKIQQELSKNEHSLSRLVLLCNTFDDRMAYRPDHSNVYQRDNDCFRNNEMPLFGNHLTSGTEVQVKECSSTSSSSDSDSENDDFSDDMETGYSQGLDRNQRRR